MAIQNTDLLLINRAGASYKVAASDLVSKVQTGDLALVNRSGSSYKLTGDKLTAGTFNDTDLFLINRAGASYQVAGSEIKTLLVPSLPLIADAQWSFRTKSGTQSVFRLTMSFYSKIDLSVPTVVGIAVTARGTGFAVLLPVTNPSGDDTYRAADWLNSTNANQQEIAPYFNKISDNQVSFDLAIPKNIVLSGSTVAAKSTALTGTWEGQISIAQGSQTTAAVVSVFNSSDDYFD